MLRGINRSIIEINETENKYFERVLIFVRPEFGALPAAHLEREASRMVGGMTGVPTGLKRTMTARQRAALRKKRKRAVLVGAVLFAAAAAICLIKLL